MAAAPAASCMSTEHGCVMFDCLVHLWEWLDPPPPTQYQMENKKAAPATQQPFAHQHLMAHHVHPNGMYSQHHPQLSAHLTPTQTDQIQPNGVMHQLLQSQYHSNLDARSPLLENRHEQYGSAYSQNQDYGRQYGVNDNYNNYPQSPSRQERPEVYLDHNVNNSLAQNITPGYNVEVYQDYLKRNPPKDSNQIYQNHQPTFRPNANQYGSKPYLPYSNRIGPQSNTELLRKQYNEIQQMKLQQQIHYQNQAQMHQQQKFAERQLLLQQIHGVQPPPNLQNSIYSDSSYRDLDRYCKSDYKDYSSPDTPKDVEQYEKNIDYREMEHRSRQYQEPQWQHNQQMDYREQQEPHRRSAEGDNGKSKSPPSTLNQNQKNNIISPIKSTSESSSTSVKSPSSDSRRSSSGTQALRSPTAQRIPSAPVTIAGILYKQGSDGLKVWRKRWFVLSEYCLFYYKSQEEEKLLGSVLLPSYRVSACTAEDKVLRKFAFKLEHANMRTYILAAPDQDAMLKWVKALTMAALMQSSNESQRHQNEQSTKIEDGEDIPMYANAPPKPRRSNDGFNSPSPDMYDPNYDLLKKPASHYSQTTSNIRNQEHNNYSSTTQEPIYTQSPQSPPQQRTQYQKRPYDSHNLSLPLTNTITDRLENEPSTSNDTNSQYFDRSRGQQQNIPEQRNKNDQIYDRQPQKNPFLQDQTSKMGSSHNIDVHNQNPQIKEKERSQSVNRDPHSGANKAPTYAENPYSRDIYGELDSRAPRTNSVANERLMAERRTPDAYSRSTGMSSYNKEKSSDYEDVYGIYGAENEYGKTPSKSSNLSQARDAVSISSQQQSQNTGHPVQEKTFSGPSVLRKKKMQSSGIQPPMPRPHSADFLEYETKNEMLNRSMPVRTIQEKSRQPQRPKSSLDINSYYDPSSETYYSEESYAEKMRQSVQYLQQGMRPRNMEIPLAKYASGLAQKQLSTAYSQITNHNYNQEVNTNRMNHDNISHNSKSDAETMNSNWTLKEKNAENLKDFLNRSGSVMSDGSNANALAKDVRYDPNSEGFIRSASARLPSATEKEGDKKVQQREESMKRLLEWKQRMLQSPLTRKSTPATISLARSLNQSRQSLRSDQYKPKTYANASYNSYSSDDEEEPPSTDLQKPSEVQAGRSQKANLSSPNIMQSIVLHTSCDAPDENCEDNDHDKILQEPSFVNVTYENIICTISVPKIKLDEENDYEETECLQHTDKEDVSSLDEGENGYETHESEAESETQEEYTDNDLDEVLLESECEMTEPTNGRDSKLSNNLNEVKKKDEERTPTPLCFGENHYLPMSPRKVSATEIPQTILQSLIDLQASIPHNNEDNPYVEMNVGSENEDNQTYEVVCVNNERVMEPVYMELSNVRETKPNSFSTSKTSSDTASNFADTKEHTLKRAKTTKKFAEKSDCSNIEIEADSSLDTPFNRFSISDTFRPASYYLNGSDLDVQEITDEPDHSILSSSTPPNDELSNEALSKYILDKLDQSDMSNDNSILKMLTAENQNMNTIKRKTTSLMVYGSHTSIHDTLSRGEKVRHNRATLLSEKNRVTSSQVSLSKDTDYCYQSSSVDTDSLKSFNADKGSSRLSLESDVSSKFEVAPSSTSSEVNSLSECDLAIDFRNPHNYRDAEIMNKRRPLSDNSLFELAENEFPVSNEINANIDLDKYLDNLQSSTSTNKDNVLDNPHSSVSTIDVSFVKDNTVQAALQNNIHVRCSSTPVSTVKNVEFTRYIGSHLTNIGEQMSTPTRSQSACSSTAISKAPISYYCKEHSEEHDLAKNLNHEEILNKIQEFETEKSVIRSDHDTNASSSTGFHSRESSTEQSAPYYYSDLSSQEHVNILPTSHYLKNTNLHRKLNNQRRRGPLLKKTEISHIHNPIRSNHVMVSEQSFDLVASARSVSVEFLSAADKDPEIDVKNIYESTSGKRSKISESMSLISTLGCKSNLSNVENIANKSSTTTDTSSLIKLSSASMSSHCSENSSNTVYYDAEADNVPYENVPCHGEKHWDEDTVWRDNLRRVSHRHARSMDDLDTVQSDTHPTQRNSLDSYVTNSLKRIQNNTSKITRNVTYVNCTFHGRPTRNSMNIPTVNRTRQKINDNDVYVSLAESAELPEEDLDEGVYEQLAVEAPPTAVESNKKRFEIDREKLRQWDLMSSGLMKRAAGRMHNVDPRLDTDEVARNLDTATDNAGCEASMTMTNNVEQAANNNPNTQQALSKKAFLGSNTSIGRNNRDNNIPVRAVSPRVRWVEDKSSTDPYCSQQMSTSQQNLHASTEDSWAMTRSPSRASQQPIRAVSPRIRRNTENNDTQRGVQQHGQVDQFGEIPTAGELLGRTHEELVLLLIQLRRRHAATHRAIEQCCAQISSIEECLNSLKAAERDESLKRLEQLKMQLMELEHQYEKSKPLVQLVDNMVKLGSLYNRPGSTIERLERNQRLRQKVLAEHALEQQRWLESVAAGKPLETEAARARVAELWSLEQELAHEADILQGFKSNKDTIENILSGTRDNLQAHKANIYERNSGRSRPRAATGEDLEAELARVHAMLAHNSKKLEQTVADNARLERELHQLRRALQARRASAPTHPTAMLEDEVTRVQQLVSALQRQRQELSRAVRHLTQQSHALQSTQESGKNRPLSSWQETNLDTGHTIDHGHSDYEYENPLLPPGYYDPNNMVTPLYVDTGVPTLDVTSPQSEDMHGGFANLTNVEKQEIKTVRIVKRESERRQRDRERSLQPMSDWPNNITTNIEQFLEEELVQPTNYSRAASIPRTNIYDNYYKQAQYSRTNDKNLELSPKYVSSPSLSNYDYSRDISSLSSSYNKSYERGYDRNMSISTQYLNSPTDSSRTLTNDPMTMSKTSSIVSLTRSSMELSPMFKSEAAKQIITEMSSDVPKNGSLHRRQVPKEKRRHNTAPHHLSAKTLNEMPKDPYNQDKLGRSVDDADMERVLRGGGGGGGGGGGAPDVVRSALPPQVLRLADNTIDQLLAAPQKIIIPERYIPEKPPELSPEEQLKRQEKVESIKKMLTSTSADQTKSPDPDDKRQREHLLQMNQILAKQVTEMSKIIAVKALEELPQNQYDDDADDRSPDVELPIYQQRDNFFT